MLERERHESRGERRRERKGDGERSSGHPKLSTDLSHELFIVAGKARPRAPHGRRTPLPRDSHSRRPPLRRTPLLLLFRHRGSRRRSIVPPFLVISSQSSSHASPNENVDSIVGGLLEKLRAWRHFLPGGSWWLIEGGKDGEGRWRKGVSVLEAFRWMWFLVSGNRGVIFLAFASLLIASFSEIAIPHFLTASIFSAQSGKSVMFYKNVKILVSLCLVSGICSGLRSCFFSIANMMLEMAFFFMKKQLGI